MTEVKVVKRPAGLKAVRFQHRIATGHSILGSPFVVEIENPLNEPTTSKTAATSATVKKQFRQVRQHLPVPTILVIDDALVLQAPPAKKLSALAVAETKYQKARKQIDARYPDEAGQETDAHKELMADLEENYTIAKQEAQEAEANKAKARAAEEAKHRKALKQIHKDHPRDEFGRETSDHRKAVLDLQDERAAEIERAEAEEVYEAPRVTLLYLNGNPMAGADWHNAVSVENDVPHVGAEGAREGERFYFVEGEFDPTDPTNEDEDDDDAPFETKHYSDGTSASGRGPLPDQSPEQQAAALSAPTPLPVSVPVTALGDVQIPAFPPSPSREVVIAPEPYTATVTPAAEPDVTAQLDSEPSSPEPTATE
jgi:hypothetical protein